jgi:predicted AAA+ superfamily ATPase
MLNSLTIYKNLRNDVVISNIQKLCRATENSNADEAFLCYSNICSQLFDGSKNQSIADYVFDLIIYDDNFFSRACARNDFLFIESEILCACEVELSWLQMVSGISASDIKNILMHYFPQTTDFAKNLPEFRSSFSRKIQGAWGDNLAKFAEIYTQDGVGVFAKYKAFSFSNDKGIVPIENFDSMKLSDFKHYEIVREKIVNNTLAMINDKSFNNVLIYGDRGTGKSSTVKALLSEYQNDGLRIIQVAKTELFALDKLAELISGLPLKFIVFIDDLTFNENDDSYNMLKAVLEGSLTKKPDNMAIYATTNRRHIIKETFTAREGDEVHIGDTIDENLSLSDRFGLIVTFSLPSKDTFLDIVLEMAKDKKLNFSEKELFLGAERFAMLKAGRSPRVARQFIDSL